MGSISKNLERLIQIVSAFSLAQKSYKRKCICKCGGRGTTVPRSERIEFEQILKMSEYVFSKVK
jgi:hypothetical protein